jgi:hypothetical protein
VQVPVEQDQPLYNAGISNTKRVSINRSLFDQTDQTINVEVGRDDWRTLRLDSFEPNTYLDNEIEFYKTILPIKNIFAKTDADNEKPAEIGNLGSDETDVIGIPESIWGRKIYAGANQADVTNRNIFRADGTHHVLYFSKAWVRFCVATRRYNYSIITTPYYILNCYPFRFYDVAPYRTNEANKPPFQVVTLDDIARPMPSTNREGNVEYVTLSYVYEKSGISGSTNGSGEIKIACVVRNSHFEYFGQNNVDDKIMYNSLYNIEEIAGPRDTFGRLKDSEREIYKDYLKPTN